MGDLLILSVIVWLIGGVFWFLITLGNWAITRDFPDLYSDEQKSAKALLVLKTPIWPLVLLGMAGRTIGELWKDVLR